MTDEKKDKKKRGGLFSGKNIVIAILGVLLSGAIGSIFFLARDNTKPIDFSKIDRINEQLDSIRHFNYYIMREITEIDSNQARIDAKLEDVMVVAEDLRNEFKKIDEKGKEQLANIDGLPIDSLIGEYQRTVTDAINSINRVID